LVRVVVLVLRGVEEGEALIPLCTGGGEGGGEGPRGMKRRGWRRGMGAGAVRARADGGGKE
jgi:hypothetical protein